MPVLVNIDRDKQDNLLKHFFNRIVPLKALIYSGESGAGKTECAKQCLKYMAQIAGSVGNVEDKVY